ncbi:MAG: 4-amino-4-deoxychorismate lyase [Proteobacteria bacterium]|nr:4-amino-4-deoxychorismate lyase [Pseudomonadota bacterium]
MQQVCNKALINGVESRSVDFADRGVQYGDGLFTTLRVTGGKPLFLHLHLDRLESDAARLRISSPPRAVLTAEARTLAGVLGNGVLKIIVTRGVGGRGYRTPATADTTRVVSCHPLPDYPATLAQCGVRVRICDGILGVNPRLAGIKHLNRLEQILARAEWDDDEVREGLMLDSEGFVVEGVMSNLFLSKGGRLMTPLLDRCGVRGVMRSLVTRLGAAEGLPVSEGRVTPADLIAADELFLTNSVIGLWPISQLGDRQFQVGPLTRRMRELLARKTAQEMACPG